MNVSVKMIRFSPAAYQKIVYFLQKDVEVGGFCLTDGDLVTDFIVVEQESSGATFDFTKEGIEDYLDEMTNLGYTPKECFRIYLHSHPGNSAEPSGPDWENFYKLMGSYPWFCMLIIAKDQSKYGYIKLTQGIGVECEIDWDVDWTIPCEAVDFEQLELEFTTKVKKKTFKIKSAFKVPAALQETESDFLNRWKKPSMNFANVSKEIEEELDEDELFEEFLKDKSLHEMNDAEFEFYQQYKDE